MPAYSCQFNSVEFVWALLKRKFPETASEKVKETTTRKQIQELVLGMIKNTPEELINNCIIANRKFLE